MNSNFVSQVPHLPRRERRTFNGLATEFVILDVCEVGVLGVRTFASWNGKNWISYRSDNFVRDAARLFCKDR